MVCFDHARCWCWYQEPPPGFTVLSERDLDAEHGRSDRWICEGTLLGRRIVRSGLRTYAAACRAAWFVYDDALELAELSPKPRVRQVFQVRLDSWSRMQAWLLRQIIEEAGSIRKAAKVLDVPRSSLGRWVQSHRDCGRWPG